MSTINQRIAAKALIIDDQGRVLLLREADTYEDGTNIGKYSVPGGRIDPGEPFLDALRREVKEECGLEVEIVQPVHVDEWMPTIKGVPTQIVGMFMLCKPKTSKIRLSEEHDNFLWVKPEEAADKCNLMDTDKRVFASLAALQAATRT